MYVGLLPETFLSKLVVKYSSKSLHLGFHLVNSDSPPLTKKTSGRFLDYFTMLPINTGVAKKYFLEYCFVIPSLGCIVQLEILFIIIILELQPGYLVHETQPLLLKNAVPLALPAKILKYAFGFLHSFLLRILYTKSSSVAFESHHWKSGPQTQ